MALPHTEILEIVLVVLLTAFVRLNLLSFAFTHWRPAMIAFRKNGDCSIRAPVESRQAMHERMFRADQAQRLEDPGRREWLPPEEVICAMDPEPGHTVADIGAGTGFFSLPLAQHVGLHGMIYAVDVQEEMLAWIRRKIERGQLNNIQLVHAEAHATHLPGESCDLFFLANLWHELDDRQAVLQEAQRVLKPEGRIAILDWRPNVQRDFGPPLEHRLTSASCVQDLGEADFSVTVIKCIGAYHWLVQAAR